VTEIATDATGRIVVDQLTKVFRGKVRAVDRLSFTVEPGSVTGFLGPNGAGKTTTLRMVLGLVRPTSGRATINGVPYKSLHNPITHVGAALESSSFHPARTGRNHLRILCIAAGLPLTRADEVLEMVGLGGAAGKRKVRGYSLGMRQRLGLACALLGDPRVLVLDEPANGLDPEGIRWLRGFFRHLATEGRSVLVSSHQLNEVQEIADRVVILNRGRLVRAGSIRELLEGTDTVVVRGPSLGPLDAALRAAGLSPLQTSPTSFQVQGTDTDRVGNLAFTSGVELHELSRHAFDLEDLFFQLTDGEHAAVPQQPDQPPIGQQPPPPPGATP
jgi:ABC-2 type transport system ATP-binding protein